MKQNVANSEEVDVIEIDEVAVSPTVHKRPPAPVIRRNNNRFGIYTTAENEMIVQLYEGIVFLQNSIKENG